MFVDLAKPNHNTKILYKKNRLENSLLNYVGNTPLVELTNLPFRSSGCGCGIFSLYKYGFFSKKDPYIIYSSQITIKIVE